MFPNVKRLSLAILAVVLWAGGAGTSWADSASSGNRAKFIALVADQQNQAIADRLHTRQTRLAVESRHIEHRQQVVASRIANPPSPPILTQLQRRETILEQQYRRILHRLDRLNGLTATTSNPAQQSALDRLRHSLSRAETTISRQIQSVQRLERLAATPSAPGGH
jgi:hypothetical protein